MTMQRDPFDNPPETPSTRPVDPDVSSHAAEFDDAWLRATLQATASPTKADERFTADVMARARTPDTSKPAASISAAPRRLTLLGAGPWRAVAGIAAIAAVLAVVMLLGPQSDAPPPAAASVDPVAGLGRAVSLTADRLGGEATQLVERFQPRPMAAERWFHALDASMPDPTTSPWARLLLSPTGPDDAGRRDGPPPPPAPDEAEPGEPLGQAPRPSFAVL